MKLKTVVALLGMTMALLVIQPLRTASAAATINGHAVVLDNSNKIVPWTPDPGDGYGAVIDSAWNYLLKSVPNDPVNRKAAFFSHSYLNPDSQQPAGWPHNPAGLYSMLVESALKYYSYSGNIEPVNLVKQLASWQLSNGMTKSTDNWANVPFASGESGSLNYQGASYGDSTGVGDGSGYLQPDKVGAMGYAWIQLYEFDGNTTYRDAAIAAGDALASHVRTGNSTQSPWPFRVNAATGAIREQYTANVIDPIQLFDGLIKLGIGNTSAYRTARQAAWDWLMTYPMKNNNWCNYFEDVAVQPDLTNENQLIPMMTARYILNHPETDSNWQTDVQGLIAWVESNFAEVNSGAAIIKEQNAFAYPMGSHTSRYASVNALLAELTGNAAAKAKAYYSLNWATYMARPNGVVIDGPLVNNQWFTDGYGDYIRHFLTSMQAFPEWAPNGQTHLTGSTSIVQAITYTANSVAYRTVDPAATDSLRLSFSPSSVLLDGRQLSRSANLNQEGWTYDAGKGVMRIRHDTGRSVQVLSDAPPGNTPPTINLTAPSNNASFSAGSDITFMANANDPDGSIASVRFFNGDTPLGSDTSAPYSYSWPKVPAGTYALSAIATDNDGGTSKSSTATITITAPASLTSPWLTNDVGAVGVTGSATSIGPGALSVSGSGEDIWDAADGFRFVYQPLNGDGRITARVVTQEAGHPWALAGVMMREDLTAASRHVFAGITSENGASFTRRIQVGGLSDYTDGGAASAPTWVRLTRVGAVFTAARSADGLNWTAMGAATIPMAEAIYIGLAVTSHDNITLSTAAFDNVIAMSAIELAAPAISAVNASNINQNGASIAWTTSEPADSQIEYGTTASYGLSTAINSSLVTIHSAVVSGLDAATTYHYRVKSRDSAGNLATSPDAVFRTPDPAVIPPPGGSTPSPIPGTFATVTPARILDTRINQGATGPVPAASTITIAITGKGGIPTTGVSAVALNLTLTDARTAGYITAAPTRAIPTTSSLNFTANQTVANLVIVPVGPDGKISLYNGSPGTTQLIADIAGYVMAGTPLVPGTFATVTPARILDTRINQGATGPVPAASTITIAITGKGGIPTTGVSAVALNLTLTDARTAGYITAAPTRAIPTTSSLNFTANQTVANLVIVPVGPDGKISLYNGSPGTTQLIADIAGYVMAGTPLVPGTFATVTPARILDTRINQGATGPVPAASTITIAITGKGGIPTTGVSAVALNLTLTDARTAGYITAAPTRAIPTTSSLNFTANQTVANLVIVPVGPDGKISLYNGSPGTTQLIADIAGYVLS